MLLVLFGMCGVGKNFVGKILASEFGYYYWDADTEILQSMREQVLTKNFFTQKMRDEFTEIIINKIEELIKIHSNVVVSQALYKEKNRNQIALSYPNAMFIQIKATQETISHRVKLRNDWVDHTYAEKISFQFEKPQELDGVIINDTDASSVISQLQFFLE